MAVKAGKLLMIDIGEYSDHSIIGFFVALQDFDPLEIAKEFLQGEPEERDYSYNQDDRFVALLIQRGLLLEIDYSNLYLGPGYGTLYLESIGMTNP